MTRALHLTVTHFASELFDFASGWVPRLVVVVRGTTDRDWAQVPAERVRFGARGVSVGGEPGEDLPSDTVMSWRFVEVEEVEGLITALDDLGLPGGAPEIECVVDTVDVFQTTIVSGAVEKVPFHLHVSHMASGLQGRDAGKFAELFRRVLAVGDLDPEDWRWRTTLQTR